MLSLWIKAVPSFHEVDFQGHDAAQARYNPATMFSLPPAVLSLPAGAYSLVFESLSGSTGSPGRSSTAQHGRETGPALEPRAAAVDHCWRCLRRRYSSSCSSWPRATALV